MTAARQPSKVHAHWMPIPSNICLENSGNPAAMEERSIMLAATAEAALPHKPVRHRLDTRGGRNQGASQRQVSVDNVVEARQEDAYESKSDSYTRGGG